jgi:hypothetical protein
MLPQKLPPEAPDDQLEQNVVSRDAGPPQHSKPPLRSFANLTVACQSSRVIPPPFKSNGGSPLSLFFALVFAFVFIFVFVLCSLFFAFDL